MSKEINVLEKIVKSVKFVKERNSKGVVNHKIKIELEGDFETKIAVLPEEIQSIKVLSHIGYEEPVKSLSFVQELSEEKQPYYCVRIDLADNTVMRKFLPNNDAGFRFKAIVDKLLAYYLAKEKEKEKQEKDVAKQNK